MQLNFYFIIALIIVVTLHEFSHAAMASHLGDPTAKLAGRVTLNPLAHLDFLGTLLLFLIGIGWGKPVPFNPNYLKHPLRDGAYISLAGPGINLLTAVLLGIPLRFMTAGGAASGPIFEMISALFNLSIILGVFNLLPVPPLDGSKVLGLFIPPQWEQGYARYLANGAQYFILFILFDSFILGRLFGISILYNMLSNIFFWVSAAILFGS